MTATNEIIPNLWLNDTAEELVAFCTSVFGDVVTKRTDHYSDAGKEQHGHEAGSVMTIEFTVYGKSFIALNGGPMFQFTPANSFFIRCKTAEEVNELWEKLSEGSEPLMELGEYPFSKRYGWLNDKFGVSWQIILTESEFEDKIIPSLMFTNEQSGKANEAIDFYTSTFKNSSVGDVAYYTEDVAPGATGKVSYGEFTLNGNTFAIMDSPIDHMFNFSLATSYMVECADQAEIDHYWESLSAVPEAEQCGWLIDKYGVSWQIVPSAMNTMLAEGSPEQIERVTNAFMQMKKFDIAKLEEAYEG